MERRRHVDAVEDTRVEAVEPEGAAVGSVHATHPDYARIIALWLLFVTAIVWSAVGWFALQDRYEVRKRSAAASPHLTQFKTRFPDILVGTA